MTAAAHLLFLALEAFVFGLGRSANLHADDALCFAQKSQARRPSLDRLLPVSMLETAGWAARKDKDDFAVALMLTPEILKQAARLELPQLIAAMGLDQYVVLGPESDIIASPAPDGGIRLRIPAVRLTYKFFTLDQAVVTAYFDIVGDAMTVKSLEISPGPNRPIQNFLHNVVAPLQRLLFSTAVSFAKRSWAERFQTIACWKQTFDITVPRVMADEDGNLGLGIEFSRWNRTRAKVTPIPLETLRDYGRKLNSSRLAVFWSDGMVEALLGDMKLARTANQFIKTASANWAARAFAGTSGMQRAAASLINELVKMVGLARHPHLEKIETKVYHVESDGLDGAVAMFDTSQERSGIMDALFAKGEFSEWWNTPSTESKVSQGKCAASDGPQ